MQLCVRQIPKTDLFEIVKIPDMCIYQNKCFEEKSAGCFLSLIKRKKITRLDEKHLILMAEKRGLFGDTNPKKERVRIQNKSVKKDENINIKPAKVKRKKSEDIALLVSGQMHISLFMLSCFPLWYSNATFHFLSYPTD